MSKFNDVQVSLPAVPGKGFSVTVDGTPLKGVRSLSIQAGFEEVTKVSVTFMANVNGNVEVAKIAKEKEE